MVGTPAIFLDRDGVLNENRPDHVKSWAEFRFLPGTLEALRQLSDLHADIFVVTNQGAIGQGHVTQQAVDEIHERVLAEVRDARGRINAIRYCPHSAAQGCRCRKPEPGLILDVAAEFDIDLSRSVFIGDATTDILAGQRANCKTILVLTGRGREAMRAMAVTGNPRPTAVASDLRGALPIVTRMLAEEIYREPINYEIAIPGA